MGRRLEIEWKDSEDELRQRYQQEKDLQIRPRYHALWLIRGGLPPLTVAEVLGVHSDSVYKWVSWYKKGGLTELARHRIVGGSSGKLTREQEQQLQQQANLGTFRTAHDVVDYVQQTFGVTYKFKGSYYLIRRLGIKSKVPRPLHQKSSLRAQEEWKKKDSKRL